MREESKAALNPSQLALSDVPLEEHPGCADRSMWVCRFPPDEAGGWGQHRHRQHQIAWVSSGVATVRAGDQTWVVPPTQALWIPSGWPHDVVNRRPATLHCFYVWPECSRCSWAEPTAAPLTLEEWARRQQTSVSTLRRLFPSETGLTFSEWRRQARLHASLQLLADGLSVEHVAARVGYASATGYIDAFKRHFGATPACHARSLR